MCQQQTPNAMLRIIAHGRKTKKKTNNNIIIKNNIERVIRQIQIHFTSIYLYYLHCRKPESQKN